MNSLLETRASLFRTHSTTPPGACHIRQPYHLGHRKHILQSDFNIRQEAISIVLLSSVLSFTVSIHCVTEPSCPTVSSWRRTGFVDEKPTSFRLCGSPGELLKVISWRRPESTRRSRTRSTISKVQDILEVCGEKDRSCRRRGLAVVPEQQHKGSELGARLGRPNEPGQSTWLGQRQGRDDKLLGGGDLGMKRRQDSPSRKVWAQFTDHWKQCEAPEVPEERRTEWRWPVNWPRTC